MQLQDNITPRYKQKFSTGSVLPGEGEGNSVEQHELLHILQTTRTIPHPIDQESMICHSRNQLVPLFEHESIVGFHLSYFRRHWYLVYCPSRAMPIRHQALLSSHSSPADRGRGWKVLYHWLYDSIEVTKIAVTRTYSKMMALSHLLCNLFRGSWYVRNYPCKRTRNPLQGRGDVKRWNKLLIISGRGTTWKFSVGDARSTPVERLDVFWVVSTVRSSLTLYSLSGSDEGRLINGLNAGVPESTPVDESEVFKMKSTIGSPLAWSLILVR